MKTSLTLIAIGAALASAQQLNQLAQCGQTCINNMIGKGMELGCSGSDAACLCSKIDFGYGVRDCANQACVGDANAAQQAIAYGATYCNSEFWPEER